MVDITSFIISLVIAYLLGSIPSGYWFGKYIKGIDLRKEGSGNVGATNALRVLGKPLGTLTLIADIAKGWFAVDIARRFLGIHDVYLVVVGLAAVCGHIFTIFLNFKGGKGVATTFGIFLAFTPLATMGAMLIWAICFFVTGYASVGSIVSAVLFPILIFLLSTNKIYLILGIVLGIFIIVRHISNIKRLIAGTENKFSFSSKGKPKT